MVAPLPVGLISSPIDFHLHSMKVAADKKVITMNFQKFSRVCILIDALILQTVPGSTEARASHTRIDQQMLECNTWSHQQISDWLSESGLDQYKDRLVCLPYSLV